MTQGVDPNDIFHNGSYYNRDGVSGGPVDSGGGKMTGPLLAADGTAAAPSYSFSTTPNMGMYWVSSTIMGFTVGGVQQAILSSAGFNLASAYRLGPNASTPDVVLTRDAANTLAQRNGTNAQTSRLYNTYTDASNYERLAFNWSGNIASIIGEFAGTGVARGLEIRAPSGQLLNLGSGANTVSVGSATFRPTVNGTVSIGTVGLGWSKLYMDYTNTGTVGDVTINKAAGRVNLAAAGTALTVTNSLVTANSIIMLNGDSAPGNVVAVQFYAVASAGSFTVNAVPAVTNQTAINFFVVSTD